MGILYNVEKLRALRFKSSEVFLKRPQTVGFAGFTGKLWGVLLFGREMCIDSTALHYTTESKIGQEWNLFVIPNQYLHWFAN